MGGLIKLVFSLLFLGIVVAAIGGAYVAVVAGVIDIPGLTGLRTEGQAPTQETVTRGQRVESKIQDAVQDRSGFYLRLTDEELTDLLAARLDGTTPVRDAKVAVRVGEIGFSGSLNGRIPVPFTGAVGVSLDQGDIDLTVKSLSVGFLPLPGALEEEIQPLITQALDVGESLQRAGAAKLQQVILEEGAITIIGLQRDGRLVSDAARQLIQDAASGGAGGVPAPPGEDLVPIGAHASRQGADLYLALGDSLAANVGVTDPRDGYVSRFHSYLEAETGRSLGLMNLGVSGESSVTILETQLPRALQELRSRRTDNDPETRVSVLTLDLGANDILGHLGSEQCQADLRGAECAARIDGAIETFRANYAGIVRQLKAELEPDAEFYLMTVYNPFDFGIGIPFEADSNDVLERLNDIIRETAAANGASVAEAGALMAGNAGGWTLMLTQSDIHPNPLGYQALAYALAQARQGR